ncbi:MAG: Rpn family recombination-promoting nuclease/putative transposase [Myxococcaceae bacterium]|nr:Rpn family recombination-promoting nuclease/putative transposase [Myxococcaceae bacterium]
MTGRAGRGRHDGYFRSAFADTRVVAAEVRAMVPPRLYRQLDLDRVDVVGARYVDERLATPESDAVFRVSTVSKDAEVFVLLEHQRDGARLMAWRVLRYVTRFWAAHLAATPTLAALPPVVPLVVANVPGGWTGPRTLEGIIEGSPDLLDAVRPYLPRLELAIDDLSTLDARGVLARPGPPLAHLAWWLLSLSTDLSRVKREANLMYPTV